MDPIKNCPKSVNFVRVELVRDWGCQFAATEIDTPQDLVWVLKRFLGKADREIFLTVNLSGNHEINSIHVVSMGCLTNAVVLPREVFKAAILSNAYQIVLAHNHCFGKPTASAEDLKITKNLVRCGKILKIQILDHIIIAGDEYLSFSEKHVGGF